MIDISFLKAMETKRVIKFTVEKGTKRPKQLNESTTLFGLFIPKRLKILPIKTKKFIEFQHYISKDICYYIPFTIFTKRRFSFKRLSIHAKKY